MAWTAFKPSTPLTGRRPRKKGYFILTTMAPMKSPFSQSLLVVLGCLLWQSAQPYTIAKSADIQQSSPYLALAAVIIKILSHLGLPHPRPTTGPGSHRRVPTDGLSPLWIPVQFLCRHAPLRIFPAPTSHWSDMLA